MMLDVSETRTGLSTGTGEHEEEVSLAGREAGDLTVGRMLINACWPLTWRDQFPNVFTAEERKLVKTKYRARFERGDDDCLVERVT